MSTSIKTFRDAEIQIRLLQDKISKLSLNVKRESDAAVEPIQEVHVHFNEVDSELTTDGSTVIHKLHHVFNTAKFKNIEVEDGLNIVRIDSMPAGIFNARTSFGLNNPDNFTLVYLWDSPYVCLWYDSQWEYYAHGTRCYPIDINAWYWINQAGAVENTTSKAIVISKSLTGSDQIHILAKNISFTAPYILTAIIVPEIAFVGFPACGICICTAGSTPKCLTVGPSFNINPSIRSYRYNSPTSNTGTTDSDFRKSTDPVPIWLRLYNDGTNIIASISYNGVLFTQLWVVAISAFLGSATQWGIWVNAYNSLDTSLRLISWQEVDL